MLSGVLCTPLSRANWRRKAAPFLVQFLRIIAIKKRKKEKEKKCAIYLHHCRCARDITSPSYVSIHHLPKAMFAIDKKEEEEQK